MNKPALTSTPLLDAITARWSPRAFAPSPVEADKLRALLEAARWAPSSYNEQPWRFILATRQDPAFGRLANCLVEANGWAVHAPVLLLSIARTVFAKTGQPNRHAWHDVGLAMGALGMQATALGLHLHQMAGFDSARARSEFAIPDGYDPVAVAAIGYLGDPAMLPEALRTAELAPRVRRELRETVFTDRFGEPASGLA